MYSEKFVSDRVSTETRYTTPDGRSFNRLEEAAIHTVVCDTESRILAALNKASPTACEMMHDEHIEMVAEMITTCSYDLVQILTDYNRFMEGEV